jgi:adenylosuccinate synthase
MPADLVIGAQWGDEGKAKVIDYLSKEIDIIVRYQGGANAGHTVVVHGKKYIFHLVPSGIIYPNAICVIGNGVVLDTEYLLKECEALEQEGFDVYNKLYISDACHIILPPHGIIDAHRERNSSPSTKIGTTGKGIGICYADKMMRIGIRVGDLLDEEVLKEKLKFFLSKKNDELVKLYHVEPVSFEQAYNNLICFRDKFKSRIINTSYYLHNELMKGKEVLLEGAQGVGLDIDFGTYPYVTSSNPTTGGALSGSGIGFQFLKRIYGISKAYTTRVGEGPFPTEVFGEEAERIREIGNEYGSTTGRPRRCGWFDVEMIKHSVRLCGINYLVITKIDVLSDYDKIKVGVGYELNGKKLEHMPSSGLENVKVIYEELEGWKSDIAGISDFNQLPKKCQDYIEFLNKQIGVPIRIISTGPDRKDTIFME